MGLEGMSDLPASERRANSRHTGHSDHWLGGFWHTDNSIAIDRFHLRSRLLQACSWLIVCLHHYQ